MDVTSLIVVALCFAGLVIAAVYQKAADKEGIKAKANRSEES